MLFATPFAALQTKSSEWADLASGGSVVEPLGRLSADGGLFIVSEVLYLIHGADLASACKLNHVMSQLNLFICRPREFARGLPFASGRLQPIFLFRQPRFSEASTSKLLATEFVFDVSPGSVPNIAKSNALLFQHMHSFYV